MKRKTLRFGGLVALLVLVVIPAAVQAGVPKDLAYPSTAPSPGEVANQVFFVNHFYGVRNLFMDTTADGRVSMLVTRAEGKAPVATLLRRYLNNDYADGEIRSRDMAFFQTGNSRVTGMLISDYADDNRGQAYAMYFPAQKRVRRFAQPPHEDSWGGSDFTFGDISLRRPWHESHELLDTLVLDECLGAMEFSEQERANPRLADIPGPQCAHKGKQVYRLKSTTKLKNWWYDYRISYVDTTTFADYRTDYYKDGIRIKVIDRDWVSMGLGDPRAQYWRYWYGRDFRNGHETMVSAPGELVSWNRETRAGEPGSDIWTEDSLKQMAE